jgi:hypothetical protein
MPPTPTRGGHQRRSALRPLVLLNANVQPTAPAAVELKPRGRASFDDEDVDEAVISYAHRASNTYERASLRPLSPLVSTPTTTDHGPVMMVQQQQQAQAAAAGGVVSFGRHRRRESSASVASAKTTTTTVEVKVTRPPAVARSLVASKQFDASPLRRMR